MRKLFGENISQKFAEYQIYSLVVYLQHYGNFIYEVNNFVEFTAP